jgi:hypothetical protein
MMLASSSNLWEVAGSVYALVGAALFCNAAFLNPAPSCRDVASPAHPIEERTLRRLSAQWLDSRVGAALLVVGFFLQVTGTLGTATLNTPAVFVLLGLALFAGYYALSKDLLVDELLSSTNASDKSLLAETGNNLPIASPPATETTPMVFEFRQDETAA